MPSSIDWLAPWPRCGSIGCAASPSSVSRPLLQVGSGSRSYSAQRKHVDLLQHRADARVPAFELARAAPSGSPGRGPRLLHLLVGRHEADVVDHRAVAHREDQEVLGRAGPHLPAVHRPVRQALARNQAAIGNGAVKDGLRRRKDVGPQLGVDAVGGNHDIGLGGGAVGEFRRGPRRRPARSRWRGGRNGRRPAGRLAARKSTKSARCMPKVAFQPEASVTCTGAIGAAVVAEVAGARADSRAPFLDGGPEAHTLQVAHRVRRHDRRRRRPRPARTPAHRPKRAAPARSAHWRRTGRRCRLRRSQCWAVTSPSTHLSLHFAYTIGAGNGADRRDEQWECRL